MWLFLFSVFSNGFVLNSSFFFFFLFLCGEIRTFNYLPHQTWASILGQQSENKIGKLSHQSDPAHYLDLVEEFARLQSALYYFQLLYESKTINNKFIVNKKGESTILVPTFLCHG